MLPRLLQLFHHIQILAQLSIVKIMKHLLIFLSEEERQHRISMNLCLYCGNSDHKIINCPLSRFSDQKKLEASVNLSPPPTPPSVAMLLSLTKGNTLENTQNIKESVEKPQRIKKFLQNIKI